jgi:ferredoxin
VSDGAPAATPYSAPPAGPPARVALDAVRCVRVRGAAAKCRRCQEVCPHDAVSFQPGPVMLSTCTECGACVAACPNGALTLPGLDSVALGRTLGSSARTTPVTIACARAVAGDASAVRCLAAVDFGAFVLASKAGVECITLRSGDCASCPDAGAMVVLDSTIELAATLARMTGRPLRFERIVAAADGGTVDPARRGFLRRLFGPTLAASRRAVRRPPSLGLPHGESARRTLLAALRACVPRVDGGLSAVPDRNWPFGSIRLDPQRCSGCPVCTAVCPTGALRRSPEHGPVLLEVLVDQDLCTACGACVPACKAGALRVYPATRRELLSGAKVERVQPTGRICPECGRPRTGAALCSCTGSRLGRRPTALPRARPDATLR